MRACAAKPCRCRDRGWHDTRALHGPATDRPPGAQVNNLREIQALRRLSPHPNIVSLLEVLYDRPSGRLALVFELMSMNLYDLIRGRDHYLDFSLIRIYLYQ